MALKFLQINAFRRRPTLDLAIAFANETSIDILLVCEPNRNAIRARKDWTYDHNVDTAIKVMNKDLIIETQGAGDGYSFVKIDGITIFSCYASPNQDVGELEEFLDSLGERLKVSLEASIIAGDFNAKSPLWGGTDNRGQTIMNWMAMHDLAILNRGSIPTFRRHSG